MSNVRYIILDWNSSEYVVVNSKQELIDWVLKYIKETETGIESYLFDDVSTFFDDVSTFKLDLQKNKIVPVTMRADYRLEVEEG